MTIKDALILLAAIFCIAFMIISHREKSCDEQCLSNITIDRDICIQDCEGEK